MKEFSDDELIDGVPADEFAQEGEDDIVTLLTSDGEEIDFVEIAGIAHKSDFYAIMQPVELLEGMGEDEALVFKVSKNQDGSDKFEIELNDEIIEAVFAEYNRLLDNAMADTNGSDSNE